MAAYIWSASRLEELLNHSQSSVAGWAAAKLFHLYPANFQSRLPQLLKDNRPEVVQKSLDLVGRAHREELIPLLKDLYLNGTEKVSARAIRLLGDWSCALAVQWMRERILAEAPLSKEQIAAMIYALGRIPDEDAYTLLKQTETAVEGKDSSHWDLFYASLLEHHRAEDVEFLLKAVFAEDRKEERRRNALGLLLAQVDPELNPTDVFFANRPAVERHILKRLERIDAAAEADSKKLFDSVRQALPLMEGECARVADVLNAAAAEVRQWDRYAGLAGDVLGLTLETLREKPGVDKWRYGAACLAVSALIGVIEESVFQQPQPGSHWRQKLEYLLRDRPPQSTDQILVEKIIEQADRQELIYTLRERLENQPESWGALRSLEILGTMGAPETADLMVAMLGKIKDELAVQAVQSALLRIGLPAVPLLIARLDSVHAPEAWTILDLLSQLPTREGVQSIVARLPSLYAESPERSLKIAYETGSKDFLPFLEKEYRTGEWDLGRVYIHLCTVNKIVPECLAEILRDVKRGDVFIEEDRRIWSGEQARWPEVIQLELACKSCSKRYQYELHEIHQHPKKRGEEESGEQDFTPYKHGLVIVDDVRCKNCQTLNRFELTARSFAQLTTASVKLLALQRMNVQPPSFYPFKHVKVDEKADKPATLTDVEQEHLNAVRLYPTKPAAQLALGKFYEYVKEYPSARKAYLQTVDLDARALEAMAGLARLDHAEGKLQEALEWVQNCYENLDRGNFYLTEDRSMFKKMVRQKRREFSRELGTKLEDKPVEIQFRLEGTEYPKNRPCPCGSGKKYKLCCMK